jgi:hypothetical protein
MKTERGGDSVPVLEPDPRRVGGTVAPGRVVLDGSQPHHPQRCISIRTRYEEYRPDCRDAVLGLGCGRFGVGISATSYADFREDRFQALR